MLDRFSSFLRINPLSRVSAANRQLLGHPEQVSRSLNTDNGSAILAVALRLLCVAFEKPSHKRHRQTHGVGEFRIVDVASVLKLGHLSQRSGLLRYNI